MSIALTYMIHDKLKLPLRAPQEYGHKKEQKTNPIITSRIEIGCLFFVFKLKTYKVYSSRLI